MNGFIATATQQDGVPLALSFGQATAGTTSFSTSTNDVSRVSNYTYTRTGINTAILVAYPYLPQPPFGGGNNTNLLTFQSATKLTYDNITDASTGTLTLSVLPQANYFAPAALPTQGTLTIKDSGGTESPSLKYGVFSNSVNGNAGTYTYAQFSPNVGMLVVTNTNASQAGVVSYLTLTFNSATGGSTRGDESNDHLGSITLGTFSLSK